VMSSDEREQHGDDPNEENNNTGIERKSAS
jgi:hypothetical protein